MAIIHKKILQTFKGVVVSVSDSDFSAELTDITTPKNPKEYMTSSLDKMLVGNKIHTECSIHHWGIGVCFFWVIGTYEYDGVVKEYMKLQTIDYGNWTRSEIEAAELQAKKLYELFNTDS